MSACSLELRVAENIGDQLINILGIIRSSMYYIENIRNNGIL